MPEQIFRYGDVSIAVEDETGAAALDQQVIFSKLLPFLPKPLPDTVENRLVRFAEAVTQSRVVEGSLGFDWPTAASSAEELHTAFQAWIKLRGQLINRWLKVMRDVNTDPNDPDLLPSNKVDEKKEKTPSSPSDDESSDSS